MLCAISCHLYNLKDFKNTHGGVLFLVKLQALAWVFFTFFKFCKCYQIAECNKNILDQCFVREETDQEILLHID